jgi:DNA-binding FadR family transcriptional regulator
MEMSREFFSSVKTTRASEEISKQIKTAIFSDRLKAGDRLPSEMALTEIFSAGRRFEKD